MYKAVLFFMLLCFIQNIRGQQKNDTLSMIKFSGINHFYKQDHMVRFIDLGEILKHDKTAKRHYTLANLSRIGYSLFAGGAFLLFTSNLCEKYIEKSEVNLFLVGAISAGMVTVSIPFRKIYSRQACKAIDVYNHKFWTN